MAQPAHGRFTQRGQDATAKNRTVEGRFGFIFQHLEPFSPPDELLGSLGPPWSNRRRTVIPPGSAISPSPPATPSSVSSSITTSPPTASRTESKGEGGAGHGGPVRGPKQANRGRNGRPLEEDLTIGRPYCLGTAHQLLRTARVSSAPGLDRTLTPRSSAYISSRLGGRLSGTGA